MTNIYNKIETDDLLNAKQATLTAATNLLGTGGSITGINFNTVINKPTYNTPLSSNVLTKFIGIQAAPSHLYCTSSFMSIQISFSLGLLGDVDDCVTLGLLAP
jgi:hypothetical protein